MASTEVAAAPAAAPTKPGNTIGRMTGLTLFTPVRTQWSPVAKSAFWLGRYIPMAQKHILQFNFIKFVLENSVYLGLPHSTVLALAARLGLATPFGGTEDLDRSCHLVVVDTHRWREAQDVAV